MVTWFQVSILIAELASAAAEEKGLVFEDAMEERLCAYSRAVAHFPTAVKEVRFSNPDSFFFQIIGFYLLLLLIGC